MWKDINGKTSHKNMQGNKFLYGNLKLLTSGELTKAIADGISVWVKPAPKPETAEKILERAKTVKISQIKSLFEIESNKPVPVNGVEYKGGYDTVSRIDSARRLGILHSTNPLTLYDKNDEPISLNPRETEDVVKGLGVNYQTLYAIRQSLILSTKKALNLQGVIDVVIPWVDISELEN